MRTTLSIQDSLLDRAKKYSSLRGITLGEVMERALSLFLKVEGSNHKKTRFKLITVKGELVDPDIDLDRTSALLNEDDAIFRSK